MLAAAAREEEEVVASAIPSGCPFHFESRREADERRMDPIESTHAARSDGSSDESSKEAKSASPTGPLSDGDGEGKAADVKPADVKGAEAKPAKPAPPPPPPGPPPPMHRRTSTDRMRREMSCPTFFPEPEQRIPPPPPAPPSKPGPAVLPPRTAGDDDGKPVTDVFTGDLEAIWSHLQFGRAYHHLAIVHMRSFGAMGGTDTRGGAQQRYGGRKGGGGAVAFNRRQSRDGGGRGGRLSLPPLLRPTSSLPFKRHGTLSPLLENKLSRSTARPEPSRLPQSTSVLFRRLTLTFVRPVRDSASLPSAVSESAPAARILENRTRT